MSLVEWELAGGGGENTGQMAGGSGAPDPFGARLPAFVKKKIFRCDAAQSVEGGSDVSLALGTVSAEINKIKF